MLLSQIVRTVTPYQRLLLGMYILFSVEPDEKQKYCQAKVNRMSPHFK